MSPPRAQRESDQRVSSPGASTGRGQGAGRQAGAHACRHPLLALTPRKLPSSAVAPQPRGQHCPGDLSQPLGLRATTHYPVTASWRGCESGAGTSQAASSLLKRPFGAVTSPGRGWRLYVPKEGTVLGSATSLQPGTALPHGPAQSHCLCHGELLLLCNLWGRMGVWGLRMGTGLGTATVPCRSTAAPALRAPTGRAAGAAFHRITECTGLERTHQDHPVPFLALQRHPNNPTLCLRVLFKCFLNFGENDWQTSRPEPMPKAECKPAWSWPFHPKIRTLGKSSSPGAI